jgi:hypothetical protein
MVVDPKEQAVRRYLAFLANPNSVTDDEQVAAQLAKLEKQYEKSVDPIAKLRLRSSIERVKQPDTTQLEADFVEHAFEWASANNIVPSAFLSMGVDPELLHRAGLKSDEVDQARRAAKLRSKRSGAGRGKKPTRRNRPPVRLDEIYPTIRKQTKQYTIADIHEIAGGSIGSARTAILSLVAIGEVRAIGTKPGARGKAPVVYETVRRR